MTNFKEAYYAFKIYLLYLELSSCFRCDLKDISKVGIFQGFLMVCLFYIAFMMNLLQVVRDHWVHVLVPMGFVFGCYLDRKNDEKLTAFRNKSLLYKRLVFVFF